MNEQTKGSEMTQVEMIREMRQDIRDLHGKIDRHVCANNKDSAEIKKMVAHVDKNSSVNTTKLSVFLSMLTIIIAGAVSFGFNTVVG
ncbi:MAG: hypothetical protein KOO63_08110 [Bacteroidales bacterium]|nr:hypothetical protein [Candidatus Latescibacterota bacterium]